MTAMFTRHWKLALLWALSLVVTGAITSAAQGQRGRPEEFGILTEAPAVVSGNDVGFRIVRTENGMPVGRIVVRVDGRWVDTTVGR